MCDLVEAATILNTFEIVLDAGADFRLRLFLNAVQLRSVNRTREEFVRASKMFLAQTFVSLEKVRSWSNSKSLQ